MAKRSANSTKDQRARALGEVWRAALAMLALCIPLCFILRTALLPLAVIIAAGAVALYVWSRSEPSDDKTSENEVLRAKIKELEERLANVEVINRFEDRLAAKQLGLDSDSPRSSTTAMPPVSEKASES